MNGLLCVNLYVQDCAASVRAAPLPGRKQLMLEILGDSLRFIEIHFDPFIDSIHKIQRLIHLIHHYQQNFKS